jgi:hypothetical protein
MNTSTPLNIVRRFLSRNLLADDRFQPPRGVVSAVEEGKLDAKVLLLWKVCVEKLTEGHPPANRGKLYAAATVYWRNKCNANHISLPKEFQEGQMGGEGGAGRWAITPGDQIEEWVKQRMLSEGLISTTTKTASEWEVEITSLNEYLADAQERIEKHTQGLSKAKSPAGVAQKSKWLASAKTEAADFSNQLKKAKDSIRALAEAANKKSDTANWSIEFEKEFQFMMNQALRNLDKKQVLDAVKKATERFENGLDMPEANWGAEGAPKAAGVLDSVGSFLEKAWNHMKGAFEMFIDWVENLGKTTKDIEKLLKDANG